MAKMPQHGSGMPPLKYGGDLITLIWQDTPAPSFCQRKGQSGETNFFSEQTNFFFQDVSVFFLPCMAVEPVGLHGSMLCLSWIFLAKMLSIPRLHVGSMLDLPP